MENKSVAAIDLGTNSCRLLIVDANEQTLYRDAVSTRMGEGMSQTGSFTDEAIKRGVDCFKNFAEIMAEHHVAKYRAIATAATRMAANGADFVHAVKASSGIDLEVIDGLEEAGLNFKGALLNAVNEKQRYAMVFDLGGGSTEITLAKRGQEPEFLTSVSIPWGARNAAEVFDLNEYDEKKAGKLSQEIKKYTDKFLSDANLAQYDGDILFMATSSTSLRLVCMANGQEKYDRDWANGKKTATTDLDEVIHWLHSQSVQEMTENKNIGVNRAPIFQSASVIFSTIYKELGAKELLVSLNGAVDSMVMELQNAAR